ncbi:hypothetical protein PB01_20100 [Psychrobacillus glaciei]|uniref:Uncharacterized protein n=1 Tax=Psychrobacillus glaciei TaxID=2283160 RepID=A0A5J6SS82_9BACI|nr:hypothetical protein [Psychrobacillus glaciei]QFG00909.1 hypothetical protein PB01_20100 [Psychrobacillus glaciei]
MKYIYERTAKYSKLGALFSLIIYTAIIFIFRDIIWKDFETHFIIGFIIFMLYGISFYFQNAAEKLPNEQKVDSQLYSIEFPFKELNFQRDVSLIPRSYLISSTGERLYKIEPSKEHSISRLLTACAIFKRGLFFSITYNLKTMDENIVCQFTIKNKIKFMQLKIYENTKSHISTVVLPLFSIKNRAVFFNANNEKILQVEAKSMYGDIDVDDINGKRLATYRFGISPYATHPAFEVQAMNVHVKLAQDLTHAEKLTFAALFYYWTGNQ